MTDDVDRKVEIETHVRSMSLRPVEHGEHERPHTLSITTSRTMSTILGMNLRELAALEEMIHLYLSFRPMPSPPNSLAEGLVAQFVDGQYQSVSVVPTVEGM